MRPVVTVPGDSASVAAETLSPSSSTATSPFPPAGGASSGQAGYADAPGALEEGQSGGPRTVKLTLARIDPLSMMKLSFLLSVALGIALVMATVVVWQLLNAMGVFSSLSDTLGDAAGGGTSFNLYDYVGLSRVISLVTFIAVINVVIMMALATVGAVLYNIASSLVGGLHVTLSDD